MPNRSSIGPLPGQKSSRSTSTPLPSPRPFVNPSAFHAAKQQSLESSGDSWTNIPRYPKPSTLQRENGIMQTNHPIPLGPFKRAPVARTQFYNNGHLNTFS
eukprot:TRINITY_DN1662_c0_g1_i1.p1 TRINITY_DN1662_c0_g1~~TRINITY_DN1662_c0_g1_i1.p1  ORF type:complete len:101 (-),score=14.47 TRINITY_DN1662_c0_g1_i1:241-543(-)